LTSLSGSYVTNGKNNQTIRHHAINDLIARAFSSAGLPATKEPSGLFRSDGKRPDGLTLVPWSSGKTLCWDVTATCPLAESYISAAARECGAAAELAASRKEEKYADLHGRYIFEPIAIETLGVFNTSSRQLLSDLGRKGKPEKQAFCSKDARCSCNVSMPYCFMTVYQPMTAPTECSYHLCQALENSLVLVPELAHLRIFILRYTNVRIIIIIIFVFSLIFKLSRDYSYRGLKK